MIRNKKELSTSNERKLVLKLIEIGINSVLPKNLMKSVKYNNKNKVLAVRNNKYKVSGRIFVIGFGKASGLMAVEMEKILGRNIIGGVVICNSNYKTKRIKLIKAGHPIPDKNSIKGTKLILDLKNKYDINNDDLVICLISGGGGSLLEYLDSKLTLNDLIKTTELLIKSGAKIDEINIVRKHLSKVKGGRLGNYFPCKVISLILSDVIGNNLSTIASGPTVSDKSTFKDAYKILKKHNLIKKIPKKILDHIKLGKDRLKETPKILTNCNNYLIGDNLIALNSIKDKAKRLGLNPVIVTNKLSGSVENVAKIIKKEILRNKNKLFLFGGETNPKVPDNFGKGGRNQQLIARLLSMKVNRNFVIASFNTDGSDYINGIAGGIIDNNSINKINEKMLKKDLKKYNSYNSLKKVKGLIKMDNTGTNVGDLIICLI